MFALFSFFISSLFLSILEWVAYNKRKWRRATLLSMIFIKSMSKKKKTCAARYVHLFHFSFSVFIPLLFLVVAFLFFLLLFSFLNKIQQRYSTQGHCAYSSFHEYTELSHMARNSAWDPARILQEKKRRERKERRQLKLLRYSKLEKSEANMK